MITGICLKIFNRILIKKEGSFQSVHNKNNRHKYRKPKHVSRKTVHDNPATADLVCPALSYHTGGSRRYPRGDSIPGFRHPGNTPAECLSLHQRSKSSGSRVELDRRSPHHDERPRILPGQCRPSLYPGLQLPEDGAIRTIG